jgi:tRNA A37 methylthiotransferase MiaB
MKGRRIDVLVDRPGEQKGTWIARAKSQAPDIDSITRVRASNLHPGQLTTVQVIGADGYDLLATLPTARARSLPVLA